MNLYPGLSVGFRTEVIGVQELVGFGRTFNTIHGLILELRRLIDGAKEDTRDTTTLQGAVNKLNDIIAKFNEITPNKLVITDEYGRYSPATYNDTTWLGWTVNPDIDNPTVELYHKNANKSETTNIVSQGAQTPNFGATFKIPTLTFDSKGHWHTKGTETVKIPEPSLVSEPDGTADVLTKMELESATGKLTNTFTKLKDVLLTGYTKDADKKGALATTDSLATGLSKIENKMNSNTDLINITASSIREEVEEIESKIRADFAEEDTKIRSEMSTMDTNIRADFKAQDDEIQKTIQGLSGQIVDALDELEATASDIRGELTAATTTLSTSISTTDTAIRADFAAADTGLKAGYEAADTALDARLKVTEGKLEGVTTTVISSIEAEAKDRKDTDDKLNTLIMNVSGTLDKTNGRIDNLINGEIGDCMKRLDGMTHPTVKESIAAVKESLSASIDTVQNEIGKVSSMAVKIAREETEPEDKNNTIWVEPTSHEIRIFDGLEWRVLVTNPMSAE